MNHVFVPLSTPSAGLSDAYVEGMQFNVLGTVEVVEDGRRFSLGGVKQRTVLGLLIANAGTSVSAGRLIESTWGEDAPDGARRSLQTYISNLRQLEIPIDRDGRGYRLAAERSEIDALWFEDEVLAAQAVGGEPEVTAEQLRDALARWRGHPYDDVDGGPELISEVARLNELRLAALGARIDADLDTGLHREIIGELDALTVEYPLREGFRAQQMVALFRAGRQAEALRAYQKTRTYLVDELGIDPSPELRDLEQRILDQDQSLLLGPASSIVRRAVLVADIGTDDGLGGLAPAQRQLIVDRYGEALDTAVGAAGGAVFAQRGSATYAVFDDALGAVSAAEATQRAVAGSGLDGPGLRMAIDAGDVEARSDDHEVSGPPISRSAGLVAAAWGGQVLLSSETQAELAASGEAGFQIRALGRHTIRGLGERAAVYELVVPGLDNDFMDLRINGTAPGLPSPIRGLPGYEFRDVVGRGTFGVVHRGYQPSVGREVAIKVIRPDLANEPDFIRLFEVEAQLIARLEHPYIVPLYDYWRDPEGAYLVMRWIRGGTLGTYLQDHGPLSLDAAAQLMTQLAPALDVAHRAGIIHRDIKPSNVLLDEDGNAYLSDFGIAYDAITTRSGELVLDPRTDVAGLGSLLIDSLGSSPPEPIVAVLETATADRAGNRYATIEDFAAAWEAALTLQGVATEPSVFTLTRNPYKGLRAFGELDADDFFGREDEVEEVVRTLQAQRMVAVVGPSGIGKSSVVRAGMVPALRGGAIDGSADWLITDMLPGPYPYEELASALIRVASAMPTDLEDELRRDPRGLARAAKRCVPDGQTAVLIIDQFEELFTLAGDDDRLSFLAMLAETVADERANVRIVVTMRADYFDRPLRFAELGDALRVGTVPISAPSPNALEAIITQPAANVGVSFEPGLIDRITAAISDQAGALPLLEYSLTELFDERSSDQLTIASYESTGGVHAALGRRAETTFLDLDDETQAACRQVFLRLVNVAEDGRDTRRRVRVAELERLGFSDMALRGVLRAFGEYRLLTFDRDPITRSPTVEVAHEAILTDWARLAEWIADQREDLLLHSRLAVAVADWEHAQHAETYLITAGRLEQHEAWTTDTELSLTSAEHEFLTTSRDAENQRRTQRRRSRRLIMTGFAAAALVAALLAVAALIARNNASDQADVARSRELSAAAIANLDRDPELSLLLALEASEIATPTVQTTSALREALADHRAILTYTHPEGRGQSGLDGDLSPDGKLLAVGGLNNGLLQLIEVETGRKVWEFDLGADYDMAGPFFIEEGRTVVVLSFFLGEEPPVGGQTGLMLLDAADGSVIRRIDLGGCGVMRPNDWAYSDDFVYATLPPCGQRSPGPPSLDINTYRIDLATGDTTVITEGEGVPPVLQAADGERRVIIGSQVPGSPLRVVDPASGAVVDTESEGGMFANISADGGRIVHDGPQGGLAIKDLETGSVVSRYYGHRADLRAWFSPDGTTMYSIGRDGTFQLWDPDTGENLRMIPHGEPIAWASVTPDLSAAAVFSAGNTARVYDLNTDVNPAVEDHWPDDCPSGFVGTEMQQVVGDVAVVAMGCGDEEFGRTYRVNVTSGPAFDEFIAQDGNGIAISSDGSLLALQPIVDGFSANVAVFDAATGVHVRDMEGLCPKDWYVTLAETCRPYPDGPFADLPWVLRFNPDGTLLAMAGAITGSVTVWEVATGAVVANYFPGGDGADGVEFSPDGTALVVGAESELIVLSTEDWSVVETRSWSEDEGLAPGRNLHHTSDGARIVAFTDATPSFFVLDATTLETISMVPETHEGVLFLLDVSSDDRLVATVGTDGFARVWELDTGVLLNEIPIDLENGAGNVAFINDDRQLLVTSRRGPIKIVTIDNGDLIDLARSRVTRGFTQSECDQYQLESCPTGEQIRNR